MNSTQRRRFERLARVSAFAAAHAADFPETSKGGQAAARLNAVIAEVERLDAERVTSASSRQQATVGKRDLRASLRAQLVAISDTAETIGLDHPEVKGSFRWSRASVSDQTLLSLARSFAAAAAPLKARFVEYDMPADFLDRLNASIGSFEQHTGRQTAVAGAAVAAGASLEDALTRGEQQLERFDTAVRNKYRDDPGKMSAWASARRLERARRPTNGDDAPHDGGGATIGGGDAPSAAQ
ncbi:MAG TPA: hypothetical protein VJ715_00760 [Pyrinomonadaceae bacterium]|nr:hypothetical protein [Pyrinomonadaceae bacterium]